MFVKGKGEGVASRSVESEVFIFTTAASSHPVEFEVLIFTRAVSLCF